MVSVVVEVVVEVEAAAALARLLRFKSRFCCFVSLGFSNLSTAKELDFTCEVCLGIALPCPVSQIADGSLDSIV